MFNMFAPGECVDPERCLEVAAREAPGVTLVLVKDNLVLNKCVLARVEEQVAAIREANADEPDKIPTAFSTDCHAHSIVAHEALHRTNQ